ncbi:MAG TPA: chromate efflux transporter [Egibacteraceae bacterium]|nr:chromate efflux transporter [Egibacteraceae bacterium]
MPVPSPAPLGAAGVDHGVSRREAFKVWALVALNSFGGPAGQIAVMHRFLVDERRWISEQRFLHALNYCMLLPGPEAQQLAIYIGWLMHGVVGGVVAGVLFVVPGIVAILGLSVAYVLLAGVGPVAGLLFGLQAAVIAVVVQAVVRIGRRALRSRFHIAVAATAFVAIFFLEVPFPLIVLGAGVIGLIAGRRATTAMPDHSQRTAETERAHIHDEGERLTRGAARSALLAAAACLVLWATPVAAVAMLLGGDSVFTQQATLFSKTAVVTFGGAYAVLAYVAQAAVTGYGWLRPGEMLTGLGMAESTPGPLIMVVQFVAFVASYRNPGALPPLAAAVAGSLLTVWVTFTPCFFFIFAGAPFIERLRGNRALGNALSAITAAVVGVILNLAVWFAVHTVFGDVEAVRRFGVRLLVPDIASVDIAAVAIVAAAALCIFRLRWGVLPTLGVGAVAGLALSLVGAVSV